MRKSLVFLTVALLLVACFPAAEAYVGLPMSYLIGRDGKISARVIGIRTWDSPQVCALEEHLLREPQ